MSGDRATRGEGRSTAESTPAEGRTPVTVLSGGLGAGKTTTLNHLLRTAGDRLDVAVLVNDVGAVNIDADLIEGGSELSMDEGDVVELSNGCICCELGDDLDRELRRLAAEVSFEYLVLEASGISAPVPIARRFAPPNHAARLYELDTTVTVVDAAQFHRAFLAGEPLAPTGEDVRPLSDLLAEQVEFCDVLLLNKCDLVSEAELTAVEDAIERLHPGVDVVRTTRGQVDPDRVLGTGRFDLDEATGAAGWKRAIDGERGREDDDYDRGPDGDHHHGPDGDHHHGPDGDHDHTHRSSPESFGVDSFVYRRGRPFHPGRLRAWLASFPESVIRSKGTLWIAGRDRIAFGLNQAGRQIELEAAGRWVAALNEFARQSYRERRPEMRWDDEWGDREIELVFIGAGMDEAALVEALDDCLLTDAEMAADWADFANPFPAAVEESTTVGVDGTVADGGD
ncbi:MAG: GTP-binding protein [Salinigranum sp.]